MADVSGNATFTLLAVVITGHAHFEIIDDLALRTVIVWLAAGVAEPATMTPGATNKELTDASDTARALATRRVVPIASPKLESCRRHASSSD